MSSSSSKHLHSFMKPLVALAAPGIYLFCKFNQFKRQHVEQNRLKATEKELQNLNNKINKLLNKLEEHESESTIPDEEDCVVCLAARATVKTFPCHHKVLCRMCFVKTIQTAISQRCLPLCCVICRAKILKLENLSKSDLYKEAKESRGFSKGHHKKCKTSSLSHCGKQAALSTATVSAYAMPCGID